MEQDSEADLLPNNQGSPRDHLSSRTEHALPSDERFDASQYAFFGRDLSQEIEIGGLDEEDDTEHEASEDVDDPFYLSSGRDARKAYESASDTRDEQRETDMSTSELEDATELTSSFTKVLVKTSIRWPLPVLAKWTWTYLQKNRMDHEVDNPKFTEALEDLDRKDSRGKMIIFGSLEIKLDRTTPGSDEGGAGSLGSLEPGSDCNIGEAHNQPSEATATANWLNDANQETALDQGVKNLWLDIQKQSASSLAGDGTAWPSSYQAQHQKHLWGVDLSSLQTGSACDAPYPFQRNRTALRASSPRNLQIMRASPVHAHVPGQYMQPYSTQSHLEVMASKPCLSTLHPQYSSLGPVMTPLAPATKWLPQSSLLAMVPGSSSQQLLQDTSLTPPQVALQYQRPHESQLQSIPSPYFPPNLNVQHIYSITASAPQIGQKMGESLTTGDPREIYFCKVRQAQRHHQQGMADGTKSTHCTFWQPLRSKYMTVEEIENIVRIQWAATHSSDPYIDDYYHQAVQTKLSSVSSLERRHFAPSHLRDLPSHTRAAVEPHAYLQVDALGRVPFSSIRRPRPLLEVDSVAGSGRLRGPQQVESLLGGIAQQKPLGQEPMVAARIAIEDGLCLLLDVDDIDRLLLLAHPPDGGVQLQRRRQLLLEGLAASLQLVDSTGVNTGDCVSRSISRMTSKDDLVFLRLTSLTKGQKLLTRYLRLLTPGSELARYVGMAVFRHLRFLFGGVHSDPTCSDVTPSLANATALSVLSMDLPALSACLAAVVAAPEQPPLRPMDSIAGYGATVVLRSVLERATNLLTDRNTAYPMQSKVTWQASFDAFFTLLTKYCTNKYDSIFHSLMMASPGNSVAINTGVAIEMSKEMPVELLRASLPHTNDHQRKLLLGFAQRSMATSPFLSNTDSDGHPKTAIV